MKQFQIQTKIWTDTAVKDALLKLPMQRAFLICDPFLKQNGLCDRLITALTERQTVCALFADIAPDPSLTLIRQSAGELLAFMPDTVIAVGGGSAIDTAKLVTHIYRNAKPENTVTLIAVPTTSGTGTEVTAYSVVTDTEKQTKYALSDAAMLPDIAILDAELLRTLPPSVTADTGMDVLTHALEAAVAVDATDFSDALAEKAVTLVFENLLQTIKNGADMEARKKMLHASNLAGNAFNLAGLGMNHAMAHAMGAKLHQPHGRCNAWLLPYVVEFNAQHCEAAAKKYQQLAERLHLPASSPRIAVSSLVRHIQLLLRQSGIQTPTECGVREQLTAAVLDELVQGAQQDYCMPMNPVQPDESDIRNIYQKLV